MERKIEEEKEIVWESSVKVENVACKVDDVLNKLKIRMTEEKAPRKRAASLNRSYFIFCNSVDAFLRHVEKPKAEIKFTEMNDTEQDEKLYSFSVRGATIRNRKNKAVDTRKQVEDVSTESKKEEIVEENNKIMDICNVDNGKNHVTTISLIHATPNVYKPPLAICSSNYISTFEKVSLDNKLLMKPNNADDKCCYVIPPVRIQAFSPPGEISPQRADDNYHHVHFTRNVFSFDDPKLFISGPNYPSFFLPKIPVLRPRWQNIENKRTQNMSPTVGKSQAYKMVNIAFVPVLVGWKMKDIFVPLQHPNRRYNYFVGPSFWTKPMSAKVLHPAFNFLPCNSADDSTGWRTLLPVYGRFMHCIMPLGCFVYNGTSLNACKTPRRRYEKLLENEEECVRLLPEGNYENKSQAALEVPQYITPNIDDEHVTTKDTSSADDKDNELITDECDDTSAFGIMSVYCNSEIHAR